MSWFKHEKSVGSTTSFSKSEEVTIELFGSSVNGSINYFFVMLKKVLVFFYIIYAHTSLSPLILSMDPPIHIENNQKPRN